MKYKLTIALVASLTSSAFAAFQAPLPEFKNEKQLAEWRAEKAAETTSRGYVSQETAFYTGKPFLASSGGYAFKYRSYNPGLARWTSEDPSGFPDGANANIYGINSPTLGFDPDGLAWKVKMLSSGNLGTKTFSWGDSSAEMLVAGRLDSNTEPNTAVEAITISGSSSAQVDTYDANGNYTGYANQNITQTYTVKVTTDGNIYIEGSGTEEKSPNNLGIAILGSHTINGSSLSFNYKISGSTGQGTNLTAVGANVMGSGGQLEWQNGINKLSGSIGITFQAVE